MSAGKKPPGHPGSGRFGTSKAVDYSEVAADLKTLTSLDGIDLEARVARGFRADDADVERFVRPANTDYLDIFMKNGLTFRVHDKKADGAFEAWVTTSHIPLHEVGHQHVLPKSLTAGLDVLLTAAENQAIGIAEEQRAAAMRMTESAFRWIGVLVPRRIRDEEIGDALEDIRRIISDPACPNVRRAVRWKIVSTCFWLLWHGVGRISAAILGRKAG